MPVRLASLADTAQLILNAFVQTLPENGAEIPVDDDGKEIAYVSTGPTFPFDQPALVVTLDHVGLGSPGKMITSGIRPQQALYYATFAVTLLRNVAVLTDGVDPIPDAETINADGIALITDASALALSARQLWDSYALVDRGADMVILPIVPIAAEGSVAGNRCNLSFSAL